MVRAVGQEWSRFRSIPPLGVDLLHAYFQSHAYARHAHDFYVIGVVESGVPTFRYRGSRRDVAPGRIMVLNPGEAHDGHSAEPSFASPASVTRRNLARKV